LKLACSDDNSYMLSFVTCYCAVLLWTRRKRLAWKRLLYM